MSHALVTGATGYIGGHLVDALLAAGRSVRCVVRPGSRVEHLPLDRIELVRSELTDLEGLITAFQQCETVFHLAGQTSAHDWRDLFRTNGLGSWTVAAACARQPTPPRLIVASSLAAAGPASQTLNQELTVTGRPVSHYGRSKRSGELAVLRWSHQVPVTIVRPGIVFGERNRELLPMFQSIAQLGIHAVPGYLPRRVALIHHADLIEILMRAERLGRTICPHVHPMPRQLCDSADGIYVAADPQFPTYRELGRMIATAVDAPRMLILPIAEPMAWLAAAANQTANYWRKRTDSFNLDKMREAFAGDWIGPISRTRSELGFRPSQPLMDRLRQTANWYRDHGWIQTSKGRT